MASFTLDQVQNYESTKDCEVREDDGYLQPKKRNCEATKAQGFALVISGDALAHALTDKYSKLLLDIGTACTVRVAKRIMELIRVFSQSFVHASRLCRKRLSWT